jgi:hypothetical protein
MPGCWKVWNGLTEVTEVTAFWGEGIGRNSHTLELQELGGYDFGNLTVLPGSLSVPESVKNETNSFTLRGCSSSKQLCVIRPQP